jgi:hypothetical protein
MNIDHWKNEYAITLTKPELKNLENSTFSKKLWFNKEGNLDAIILYSIQKNIIKLDLITSGIPGSGRIALLAAIRIALDEKKALEIHALHGESIKFFNHMGFKPFGKKESAWIVYTIPVSRLSYFLSLEKKRKFHLKINKRSENK